MFDTARVILTIVVLGFSAVPAGADLNKTHARNPVWTGHARYHVVWQVTSYVALALIALGLLWIPGPAQTPRVYLVCLLALSIYGGFFAAAFTMRLYDGRLYDENGYPPKRVKILGRTRQMDLNVTAFSTCVLLLGCGFALLVAA